VKIAYVRSSVGSAESFRLIDLNGSKVLNLHLAPQARSQLSCDFENRLGLTSSGSRIHMR
jgi:hypothetical protein